ncbi:uncharacterized protein LOC110693505 [Chenopodium quinoa]|uniref:uncharacterized protein LOC110693505 n=1 Tax=Chenopodium quinoa TaxID=63459 RepID=UPI000B777890|nr:uncharacterized protein LOC110693505 [Chenopodium quinoa]
MASSESMEDKAFSERVKKTFGSLFATLEPSPKSLSNPLWSLTDSQVEKKEWRREIDTSRDSNPCSSSFDDFLSHARKNSRKNLQNYRKELQDGDLRDLDGDGDDEEDGGEKVDLNDLDVKASIGMDSTLDNEDEEDTFDKVALGRENAGDRLYMRDVTGGHDSHFSALDDLPGAVGILGTKGKDPRANRQAARIRLKEDDAEAAAQGEHKPEQSPSTAERDSSVSTAGLDKLKPILKRKERESTSKPSKRVRFDPLCISNDERASEIPSNKTETMVQVNGAELNQNVSRVPDHVQNPSKYTCYTLDSTEEMGNKSNTGAYLEFVEMMKAKNSVSGSDSDVPTDLPKSVTFVPKKKSDTSKGVHNDASQVKGSDAKCTPLQSTFLDMAAEDQETEAGDMDIDEPETSAESDKGIVFRKQGRQYRKPQADEPA